MKSARGGRNPWLGTHHKMSPGGAEERYAADAGQDAKPSFAPPGLLGLSDRLPGVLSAETADATPGYSPSALRA